MKTNAWFPVMATKSLRCAFEKTNSRDVELKQKIVLYAAVIHQIVIMMHLLTIVKQEQLQQERLQHQALRDSHVLENSQGQQLRMTSNAQVCVVESIFSVF